jgi:hypothetical protein
MATIQAEAAWNFGGVVEQVFNLLRLDGWVEKLPRGRVENLPHEKRGPIMRLTLRTLIAYLDDELQPDQAKEIGQKLSESQYALALVERIKEVMRRRRLSAPELFGKGAGLDPNLVAEYLDSELTPAEVVDVEKICLDSDMHLAEVAACHQILTLVLGDPVDVSTEMRSRMYALGPAESNGTMRASDLMAGARAGRDGQPIPHIASAFHDSSNGSSASSLPSYLQPNTSWRQTAVLAVIILIGIGWIGLVMRDPTVRSGLSSNARQETEVATAAGANSENASANDGSGLTQIDSATTSQTPQLDAKVEPGRTANETVPRVARNELPLPQPSEPSSNIEKPSTDPAATVPTEPVRPAVKPAPQTLVEPTVGDPSAQPEPAPLKLMPTLPVRSTTRDGILLRFVPDVADFMVVPGPIELVPGDRLACPEPFRADFTVGNENELCGVALIGGTAVTALGPDEHASWGFEIHQGALVFDARAFPAVDPNADDLNQPALPITLLLYGQRWRLELASDDAACGIEIRRLEPTKFETEPPAPGYSGSLYVARGVVRCVQPDGKVTTIQGPGFFPLTTGAAPNVKASEIGRASQLMIPDWLEPDAKRAAQKGKRTHNTIFEREFVADQRLLLSLPAVMDNPRPAIAELAVKCLAITDSYEPLVKALSQPTHREARQAAIVGLSQWLPLQPKNRQLLKSELAKHFLPSDSEAIYRLLWGFDDADARNPTTSRKLVEWLESEHIAIRELAFWHIQRLTGLKFDYSPNNPPGQRRTAVDRWYNHLDKKGGALVAE